MEHNSTVILTAYLLDLVIGDPQWKWHPVRIMGKLIEILERKLNRGKASKIFKGVILTALIVGITILLVGFSLKLVKLIHPMLFYIFSALFIYFALSVRSLATEAKKVYFALLKKDIQEARKNLSMIVARDTKNLDGAEIIRGTVETVAESTMDGIVAPLFYCLLGGPVLVWAYKAINTLDSMVGYKNERYKDFGKIAAKLDAIVNFIPAKITSILISIASLFYRKNWLNSFKWTLKYIFQGPDKNSEATEAAMAGSLNIQLGGLNFYNSIVINKPLVGDKIYTLEMKHIDDSIKISYISSVLFVCLGLCLLTIL